MKATARSNGQVLVLFVLFLLVLLGISALAIDYASWLLTDRALQNVADHAALAGASQFEQRETQGTCAGGSSAKCVTARAQAWASISNELGLNLSDTIIQCLGSEGPDGGDSPAAGEINTSRASAGPCTGEAVVQFGHTIWVATPPPDYAAYTDVGGRYTTNYGVVFVRVDRQVRSFFGGALGIQPDPRHGWATAGALPTDYALEIFCRDADPRYQNCKSDGLSIDGSGNGSGGIRLIRGDIASNESVLTTSQNNKGIIVEAGNVFVVNGTCSNSSWTCPASPAVGGGIADDDPLANPTTANMKNPFYIPPISVPHYQSPVDVAGITAADCAGAAANNLCIPFRNQTSSSPTKPGTWSCGSSGPVVCGTPQFPSGVGVGDVYCLGANGGSPSLHYYPTGVSAHAAQVFGDLLHPQSNGNEYLNIDDNYLTPDPDTTATNPPADWAYVGDVNVTGGGGPWATYFTVNLGQAGNRTGGPSTVRFVAFKTFGGVQNLLGSGNPVTVQVSLLNGAGTTIVADSAHALTDAPQLFSFTVASGLITDYNSLQLRFTFGSSGNTTAPFERGGAIAWAGIEHPEPQPPTPPMIPPGYYQSIDIEDGGCAVLDPTAEYSSLKPFQMPGIYRFGADEGGSTSESDIHLKLGTDAYLIGDGVTLVFDPPCSQVSGNTRCWPDSGSQKGLALGADSGLVMNTATTAAAAGVTPCTPYEEFGPYNPSDPLVEFAGSTNALPYSALCAAWAIDPTAIGGSVPGQNAWAYCDTANPDSASHCTERANYNPVAGYRGITFYFAPTSWSPSDISNRMEMQGGSSGLAFRGVLFAPYDDVAISGANGFSTVGMVLAWTAKFHGGSAFIDLDYPFSYVNAKPYLLEPTVDHN